MQVPIIVDNKGDVFCFDSIDKAERYLEPIDVRNGEYEIYDRSGTFLKATIVKHLLSERVKLEPASEPGVGLTRLREVLMSFLERVGTRSERPLAQWSIEELLLEMVLRYRTN